MSNYIKSGSTIYSAVTKNTTFNIGVTGADDYGPTSQKGFYKGIIPPVGGYTIYMHKELQGPSIHVADDDNQCIFFLKSFGATGSTISEVLAWSTGRTDIWVQTAEITINDITGNTQQIVSDGLVLKLDASNPSSYSGSGNIWYDLAGTQDNITLYNTPTFTSGTPSYFTFNGSNEYGLGSNGIIPSTGYTKSVWVYLNAYQDNNMVSGDGHFIYMGNNASSDKKIYCGHSNWGNFMSYPSTSTIDLNTWYNITLTFNTTDGMKLYINGVLDSTYTANKNAHPGTGTVNVATYNGGNLLNGRIAKVYCYDKSITSNEVLTNYNSDVSNFV